MTARTDTPQPGFFRFRMTRGGPYVGARIMRTCCCTVNGGEDNAPHEWDETCDRFAPLTCFADGVERPGAMSRVWLYGEPIERAEYDFMVADASWTRDHAPDDAKANPTEAIDLNKMPSIF